MLPSKTLTHRSLRRFRLLIALATAAISTSLLLKALGMQPLAIFSAVIQDSFGSTFGLSEVFVRTIPVLLCALATALPAWVGLTNIGGEGQFYLGAIGGSAAVLFLPELPSQAEIPIMLAMAFLFGAIWAGVAGVLRAWLSVNETLSSLLLNFIAVLLLNYLVHGPLRDPKSYSWPYSRDFPRTAILPTLGDSRVHIGLALGLVALLALAAWREFSVWGFRAQMIEGNAKAARLGNINVNAFIVASMLVAGGLAALAGISEVSAIQGRLRPEISPGYGYNGFLVAWLAEHRPALMLPVSFLVGCLMVGGDSIQIKLKLPFATVNIVLALLLLSALGVKSFFDEKSI